MKNLLSTSAVGAKIDYGKNCFDGYSELHSPAFWRVDFSLDKAFEIIKTGPSY